MENKDVYELTNPQKSIWYMEEFFKGSNINNICGNITINEVVDFNKLKEAINIFIHSNDCFNIRIILDNNIPKQYLCEFGNLDFDIININSKDEIISIEKEMVSQTFNIIDSPLFVFKLFKLPNGHGGVVMNIHHIISDAATIAIISTGVAKIYSNLMKNFNLDIETFSYIDYINSEKNYLKSEKFKKDEQYWNEKFETIPEVASLPSSLKNKNTTYSSDSKRISFVLNKNIVDKIRELCSKEKISVYNFFMAVYSLYIGKVSNLDDFVIGTPILNRTNFKEKHTPGMFISNIPFRIDLDDNLTFSNFVSNIANDTLGMLRHQKYPYQYLLENLRKKYDSIPNLYDIIISYQITKTVDKTIDLPYTASWFETDKISCGINIHIHDNDDSGNLTMCYDYLIDKYSPEDINSVHNRILHIVDQLLTDIDLSIKDIEIVTPEEKNKILYEFNNTYADYPTDKTVIDLFEEQVEKTPNNVAVVCNDKSLTYKELNSKANQLANYLRNSGIKNNDIVGILINRSLEMVIGLLGILKSGATYLPIDPDYPSERIFYMLENSNAKLVIVNNITNSLIPSNYKKINISNTEDLFNFNNTNNLNLDILPSQLMYLIYTSGSTGNPKGVMITHNNFHNFIVGMSQKINFSNDKTMVSLTTICFDIFGLELWCSLLNGVKVVIANELEQKDIKSFNLLCKKYNISMMQTTPSRFSAFLKDDLCLDYLKNLKDIIVGGEAFPKVLLTKLKKLSNANIFNVYGPTETTVWSTFKDLTCENDISIGKPIANTTCYILDKNGNFLPPFVIGTLYIGGLGVSKGYFNNQTLTNEKFVKLNCIDDQILYNTNDLAYYDNNGEIFHIGRADYQIKLRGYRIELGEIENSILDFTDITSCAVTCQNSENSQILCAYYTSKQEINISKLKEHLLNKLPTYMMPTHFIHLDNLPTTPNGKIDRKSLKFNLEQFSKEIVLPQNETEQKLCDIISTIVPNVKISTTDDLFSIGLDSIGIIDLSYKIERDFDINISIKDLYEVHSIVDLANLILSSSNNIINHIKKAKKQEYYPLSYSQKEMFYASQIDKNSIVYNVSCGFLIDTILDTNKAKRAFEKIVKNQPVFRTKFEIIDGVAYQSILDSVSLDINVYEDSKDNIQKIVNNFPKPFDLGKAPLLRVSIYILDNTQSLILIDSHHIIMDGTSLSIIMDDFCKIYNNEKNSVSSINYIDYTVWENNFINSNEIKDIENYWLNKFNTSDLPILNLPYDYTISNVKSFKGDSINLTIEPDIFEAIEHFSKKYSISPYTFFISVFYILLYKYTGQNDIIIGTPVDLRRLPELQNMIGMFVNNMVLRNILEPSKSFVDILSSTHNLIKEALSNQPYPYDKLVKELNCNSLLDVVFTYQTPHNEKLNFNNYDLKVLRPDTKTSKFNLLLEIIPDMNTIRLEYNTDLFKYQTVDNFIKHYIYILKKLLNSPNQIISDFDIITPDEKCILNEFNNTSSPINNDTIVTIFEKQVIEHPDNIALICDDKKLTYTELNNKANCLANLLISKGIGRNDIVCIMTNRSLETIVCMLGILKAGAAFFNVDPTYPIERTKYYIEDSKTKYVLTQTELKERVNNIENCIEIDLDKSEIYDNICKNPNVNVKPYDLSYIIYTSGSTGTPKGVMLHQIGFANMAKAMTKALDYLRDGKKHTLASVTSTPFDIFVYEIFVSLTHGLTVVMANNAEHRNPKLLDELIRKYNVDVMTVTPSLMKINYDNREPNSALALVKNMVFGGEPLPEKFVKDLKNLSNDITIYNIYGPSEITILSNVQNLNGEKEITVGPPIMNTQIHILDKNMKPVPIGVIGEIYISGIQVGLGYIGKDEMTASRFLENPFGSGKVYKSGDIGRWTFDGKVQCLGRIDNQIKLRGLRIELGEIENIIQNINGVTDSIVNKLEINGRETLCGYFVSDSSVSEKMVKDTLKAALPQYMIPTYIIKLDKMPYTINRKIDRKALPLPNLHKSIPSKEINIEELNSNEEKLLQIWKNILGIEDIDINDNFFDIGGDSISAIQMQIEAIKYGLSFEYADIFNYPTIKKLSNKLPNSEISFIENYDYNKINSVLARNTIENFSTIVPTKVNNILLIGSTGFLGSHIIDEFLKQNSGIIYCLIRPKNGINPLDRLKQTLTFYFGDKYINEFSKRIQVVTGDITKENLGLSDYDYTLLKNNIDVIINSGAIVKHYGLRKEFEDINVLGTKNIVDFCQRENKRLLHISTMSVSGSGEKEEAIIETPENINNKKQFYETNLFIGQKIKGIYTTTKYKAELIVLEAIYDGLDAQILRLGNITNRYCDGVFQQNIDNNAFAKRIKSFIEIGAAPKYMLKHSIELTPVDLASDAIVKILNHNSKCSVFHIYNTKLLPVTLLVETLKSLNYDILPMSNDMFASLLTGILADNNKKDILSGIIYDLDESKKLIYTYDVRLHATFTEEYLKHLSFNWKDIDENYIIKYMNYFKKINFINGGVINE